MKARWLGGALLAGASAGPLVVLSIELVAWRTRYIGGVPDWQSLAWTPLILLFACLIGLTIALPAALLASAALTWAGEHHRSFRHPLVWGASGYAVGWVLSVALAQDWAQGNWMLAATGATCALLARWRTSWTDEAERS